MSTNDMSEREDNERRHGLTAMLTSEEHKHAYCDERITRLKRGNERLWGHLHHLLDALGHCDSLHLDESVQSGLTEIAAMKHQIETYHDEVVRLSTESHPAAAEQPAPTGEGTDVILDLVGAIRRGDLDSSPLRAMAASACHARGWDLYDVLLARREKGTKTYGRPLHTNNGRDAGLDRDQEIFDALIYDWQDHLEREGK